MDTLNVGVFVPTAPMVLAQSMGIFRDRGLEVTYERVASSEEQFRDFVAGRYDLLETAFDNVASYGLNASNPRGRRLPIRALFALDGGMDLSLMAVPHITSVEQLRGGTVSLDAIDTGFAFVLFRLLESAGLNRGADYSIVGHGGVTSRYEHLLKGDADATLLNSGLEVLGASNGLNRLVRSRDVLYPYLGSVIAAGEDWISENTDVARRFREAYEVALAYTIDPVNSADVAKRIVESRSLPIESAAELLTAELQDVGVARSLEIDSAAARTVLELRAANDGFDSPPDIEALSGPGSELIAQGGFVQI